MSFDEAGQARIFISYKRDAEPDVSLAQLLYEALRGHGYRVFKDVEAIPLGGDYAELISTEIRSSDFFVVLLTRSSTREGWVAAETEMAKDSADHTGRPRILPIRLAYTQALSLRLKAAIGHLNHLEWHDAADNDKVLGALIDSIAGSRRTPGPEPSPPRTRAHGRAASRAASTSSSPRGCGTRTVPGNPSRGPRSCPCCRVETSLSVTRATGPGQFRVRVLDSGALEVAIWSGADYRRVRSQPRKFMTMLEGDTHAWCFTRHPPGQSVVLKRPDGRPDPIVLTFEPDVVRAVWTIVHRRAALHESFLIVMKHAGAC